MVEDFIVNIIAYVIRIWKTNSTIRLLAGIGTGYILWYIIVYVIKKFRVFLKQKRIRKTTNAFTITVGDQHVGNIISRGYNMLSEPIVEHSGIPMLSHDSNLTLEERQTNMRIGDQILINNEMVIHNGIPEELENLTGIIRHIDSETEMITASIGDRYIRISKRHIFAVHRSEDGRLIDEDDHILRHGPLMAPQQHNTRNDMEAFADDQSMSGDPNRATVRIEPSYTNYENLSESKNELNLGDRVRIADTFHQKDLRGAKCMIVPPITIIKIHEHRVYLHLSKTHMIIHHKHLIKIEEPLYEPPKIRDIFNPAKDDK